ncbi:MAG: VanZ family protein [Candidatus Promineifilaceae bacterium]
MMKWIAGGFVIFILYVIYLANSGADHVFFQFVRWVPYGDKIGHLGLIGTLALLVNLAVGDRVVQGWRFGRNPLLLGTLVVSILVVLEELSQLFLVNRTFDLIDLTFDFIGIALANWFVVRWHARQKYEKMQPS